jgi:hypothetical protein
MNDCKYCNKHPATCGDYCTKHASVADIPQIAMAYATAPTVYASHVNVAPSYVVPAQTQHYVFQPLGPSYNNPSPGL